ncbi:MAG: response regulator transcription factor [Flavobacteriales bacterium]|nr:response regulator transcription factor [Flavobacteriales bacterium]
MKNILLVEDEENLHEAIKLNLDIEGYSVTSVFTGKNAVSKVKEKKFDLIILDVMLPDVNGFDICETIRLNDEHTPILFLTAKSDSEDRIKGLTIGGDDYLTKPFNIEELLLRIKLLIKRSAKEVSGTHGISTFQIGEFTINFNSFEVSNNEGVITPLTKKQINLLKLLIDKKNQAVSRQEILEKVWGYEIYPTTRTIDNVILSFRKIFEKNTAPNTYFKSIRGVGYKFTP